MNKKKSKKIIEFKKEELDYVNSLLFSNRCELDLLSDKQKVNKSVKEYLKIVDSLEKKLTNVE